MGASESRLDESEAPRSGYHVVRVAAGSPAHNAGIEPFFDFCVGIDGVTLEAANDSNDGAGKDGPGGSSGLGAWKSLEEREGTQVVLNVWNSKRQELRDVPIVPSRVWSSGGSSSLASEAQPSLLGLSLRFCDPSHSLSNVWHILEILEGSPAQSAGLVPYGDFIIGWTGGALRGEGDFYELIESHVDKALRLYVYNSDYDHTREVIIVPNREWGGEGLLGCGVGYGLLHRIPKPSEAAHAQALEMAAAGDDVNGNVSASGAAGIQATPRMGFVGAFTQDADATPTQNGVRRMVDGPPRQRHESIAEEDEEQEADGGHEHDQGVTVSMRHEEEEDDEVL
ncbi:hypothetical protein K437DRAFT_258421 [Tilletiaria anomala UBC 951]|uniref:PDZ GRASP-type domain-containing protein n=1 Tax=Tilletiaria anomala (strain ATCC 24038 / CBS 436.72 / UBC 951) TaxID=1037660 RepID=A0A066VQJ1_TILAU|nr:uncharacterized protein K437DRAFT_258421 [Tilletiaria anomala UBC 951]KDN41064.1 hypothetical protein K437DRAFT_258421 [Tilletiaria anomala UBC 951]